MTDGFLAGRTALVTGGGSGLGREIALALAADGADVVLAGRSAATLESVRAELEQRGSHATAIVCDVSDVDQVQAMADQLADTFVSILINNAGIGGPVADLVDIDPADWDEVFDINVRGTFLPCRAFLPAMVARETGDVINLASVSGKRPLRGRTPYTASKMAVIGLTSTLAFEVGEAGVKVNSLSPGPVRGDRMTRNFALDAERRGVDIAEVRKEFTSRAALGRMLEEDEVGKAVVAMLRMPGMSGADIDLSAGMVGR